MTKEDLDLIVDWFAHIEQIADDRKTLNGAVMEDWAALDEIKCKAKNCLEYIKAHCNEPSLPAGLDEAAKKSAMEAYPVTVFGAWTPYKRGFMAGAEWMAGQHKFDYTKKHHTALILSKECMSQHGWFERERDIIALTEFLEKIFDYDNTK